MPEATSCLEVHGGSEQLEVLLGMAGEDRPTVACMAERGSSSEWQLTHYGASALETVEIRAAPRLLFELPAVLPPCRTSACMPSSASWSGPALSGWSCPAAGQPGRP